MTPTVSLAEVVDLVEMLVPSEYRPELATDPEAALPRLFAPLRLQPLSRPVGQGDDACSCDGYYDMAIVPGEPVIMYRNDVSPRRTRFTLLHELGHHLIRWIEPELLDLIDECAGATRNPEEVEERVCHELAGRILVPADLLTEVIGEGRVTPRHIAEIYRRAGASWEASAMRVAANASGPTAVIVMRSADSIAFAASSPSLAGWWPRGSSVDPNGPLAAGLRRGSTAEHDIFRYHLPGAQRLWCDVRRPYDGVAIGVLSDRPSTGQVNLLDDQVDRPWDSEVCLQCGGERQTGWCSDCTGKFCDDCGVCGCWRLPRLRPCEGPCGTLQGPGAYESEKDICRDCIETYALG